MHLIFHRPVENTIGVTPGAQLWRRYSEFELLRNYLMAMYPYVCSLYFILVVLVLFSNTFYLLISVTLMYFFVFKISLEAGIFAITCYFVLFRWLCPLYQRKGSVYIFWFTAHGIQNLYVNCFLLDNDFAELIVINRQNVRDSKSLFKS